MNFLKDITDWKQMINEVICADCMEAMKMIPDGSVDLIVTDPPYNIGQDNKRTKRGNKIVTNKEAWGEWDNFDNKEFDEFMFKWLAEAKRILIDGGGIYCFTARKKNGFYCDYACNTVGFTYQNTMAIIKENPLPHFSKTNYRSTFELAFYLTNGKPKTLNFISQQVMVNVDKYFIGKKESAHPTEKPRSIIQKYIQVSSNPNDLILDPFLGSGTTARACKDLGRNFIGFELSEKYCAIADGRLRQEVLF